MRQARKRFPPDGPARPAALSAANRARAPPPAPAHPDQAGSAGEHGNRRRAGRSRAYQFLWGSLYRLSIGTRRRTACVSPQIALLCASHNRVETEEQLPNATEFIADLARSVGFLSRLPVPGRFFEDHDGSISRAVQAFPVAGLVI